MLGDLSNVGGRARNVRSSVIVSSGTRRGGLAALQRRPRARDDVPAWGQIVLRSSNQILR